MSSAATGVGRGLVKRSVAEAVAEEDVVVVVRLAAAASRAVDVLGVHLAVAVLGGGEGGGGGHLERLEEFADAKFALEDLRARLGELLARAELLATGAAPTVGVVRVDHGGEATREAELGDDAVLRLRVLRSDGGSADEGEGTRQRRDGRGRR